MYANILESESTFYTLQLYIGTFTFSPQRSKTFFYFILSVQLNYIDVSLNWQYNPKGNDSA